MIHEAERALMRLAQRRPIRRRNQLFGRLADQDRVAAVLACAHTQLRERLGFTVARRRVSARVRLHSSNLDFDRCGRRGIEQRDRVCVAR